MMASKRSKQENFTSSTNASSAKKSRRKEGTDCFVVDPSEIRETPSCEVETSQPVNLMKRAMTMTQTMLSPNTTQVQTPSLQHTL